MIDMITYEEVVRIVRELPGTQLPAIMIVAIDTCLRKGCFKPGGINRTVKRIENQLAIEKGDAAPNPEVIPKAMKLTCGTCYTVFTLDDNNIHRRCGLNGCKGKLHKV